MKTSMSDAWVVLLETLEEICGMYLEQKSLLEMIGFD